MYYTVQCQSESGNFSCPYPEDIEICNGLKEVYRIFDYWRSQHDDTGADDKLASIWVCYGKNNSIEYPDFIVKLGKRNGIIKERT